MNKLDQELKKLDKLLEGDPSFLIIMGQYKMILEAFRDYTTKFTEIYAPIDTYATMRPVDSMDLLRGKRLEDNLLRSLLMESPSYPIPEEPKKSFDELLKDMNETLVKVCQSQFSAEDTKEIEEEEDDDFVGISLYEYMEQVELLVQNGYDVEDAIKIIEAWKHHED